MGIFSPVLRRTGSNGSTTVLVCGISLPCVNSCCLPTEQVITKQTVMLSTSLGRWNLFSSPGCTVTLVNDSVGGIYSPGTTMTILECDHPDRFRGLGLWVVDATLICGCGMPILPLVLSRQIPTRSPSNLHTVGARDRWSEKMSINSEKVHLVGSLVSVTRANLVRGNPYRSTVLQV